MPDDSRDIDAVIAFWREAGPDAWFTKSDEFDAAMRTKFGALQEKASAGERDHWAKSAKGALALLLLLDQFSRNLFRGDARAFAQDAHARAIADAALDSGYDAEIAETLDPRLRSFFYLPFMHSEDVADQDRCVALYEAMGDEESLKYAHIHRDIIVRFGRFPHRNPALGRDTTAEEQAFLDAGGFSG